VPRVHELPCNPSPLGGEDVNVALAEAAGKSCRGRVILPTDNFWYAWLIAALARGVVRNQTGDKYTAQLADLTLRQIAEMADSDQSFYDT
jgi:hypothetical protein